MSITLEAFGLDRLNTEDRLKLARALLDSIDAPPMSGPISDALRAELDRRWADHLANPDDVVPWEQVEAEALARIRS